MAGAHAARESPSKRPSGAVIRFPRGPAKRQRRSPITRGTSLKRQKLLEAAKVVPLMQENANPAASGEERESKDPKRMKCQVLGYMLGGKPLSKEEASWDFGRAWELAGEHGNFVRHLLRKNGMLPCKKQDEADILALGRDAAFLAALTWNPSKAKYTTHLSHQIKRCARAVFELRSGVVAFPDHRASDANTYRKWSGKNGDKGVEEFASELGISPEEAEKRKLDYCLYRGSCLPMDAHAFFNSSQADESTNSGRRPYSASSSRDVALIAEIPNSCGLQESGIPSLDHSAVSGRLKFIINEVLQTERDKRVLQMHFWERMTLEDIGEHYGVTRERIRQIEKRCLFKLASSKYGGELRELLFALQ